MVPDDLIDKLPCQPSVCHPPDSLFMDLGLRHLPLYDKQMSQFLFSTLFVQLDIRDVVA